MNFLTFFQQYLYLQEQLCQEKLQNDHGHQQLQYRKRQKLHRRKVLRFIGFYHNVGKTFAVLL